MSIYPRIMKIEKFIITIESIDDMLKCPFILINNRVFKVTRLNMTEFDLKVLDGDLTLTTIGTIIPIDKKCFSLKIYRYGFLWQTTVNYKDIKGSISKERSF